MTVDKELSLLEQAVQQLWISVWCRGRYKAVSTARDIKTTKKPMVKFDAKLLLPADLIDDHLRLQIGVCQLLDRQIIFFKFAPRCKDIGEFDVTYNRILVIDGRI